MRENEAKLIGPRSSHGVLCPGNASDVLGDVCNEMVGDRLSVLKHDGFVIHEMNRKQGQRRVVTASTAFFFVENLREMRAGVAAREWLGGTESIHLTTGRALNGSSLEESCRDASNMDQIPMG